MGRLRLTIEEEERRYDSKTTADGTETRWAVKYTAEVPDAKVLALVLRALADSLTKE